MNVQHMKKHNYLIHAGWSKWQQLDRVYREKSRWQVNSRWIDPAASCTNRGIMRREGLSLAIRISNPISGNSR
ncbi:MAG: hypothetical protein CLLPBCKN_001389 [Chroococcidiopsis cubana SAG 39.79]|nr:hypothetical protein [Chroococcidiopsis cubana SAG 39.79]